MWVVKIVQRIGIHILPERKNVLALQKNFFLKLQKTASVKYNPAYYLTINISWVAKLNNQHLTDFFLNIS